jgi:DNA repair protein RecN (Recombination protein N)
MLIHLAIENYALIDHLDIDFYKGFTAITGETGAGKSILMDALDLVLGKRADTQVLLDPTKKCIVEATFSVENYNLRPFFEEAGVDYEKISILRREVSPNGKSRAFINDTPVPLGYLKLLGDLLVDIHAQHATTSLQNPDFQLSVIDSYGDLEPELSGYQSHFQKLKNSRQLLKELVDQEVKYRATLDYKQFIFDELNLAAILPDEQVQLEEQITLIIHAEEIKTNLYQVQDLLNNNETSVLNFLSQVETNLHRISLYHPDLEQLTKRLESDLIDLKDISIELARLNDHIEFDQEQLNLVQERLDLLYRLQHKHHVASNKELLEIIENLNNELSNYSTLENQIKNIELQITEQESDLKASAEILTFNRKAVFPSLENEMISSLKHLGMPDARFEIKQKEINEFSLSGQDRIEFYFNANEGHSLKPLTEIASGGELSRVMLSIKSIISKKKLLPTIIFDEIDNGLSGDVAGRVGDVLSSAALQMQVITITHLPQIAGKAQYHYSVFKQNKNNITYSNIKFLDHQERIAELAKMIGGREITVGSLAAAKELLTSPSEIHKD